MITKEKVKQAADLLNEFDIDCWLTFVRETQLNGDPILPYLITADLTWHSALVINRSGDNHAIVGQYDKATIVEAGAFNTVEGFVTGIKDPFISYIKKLNPSKIAINFSKGSEICDGITYGMYLTLYDFLKEIGFEDRLISAEKIVSALRERKSPEEISRIRKAIEYTEDIFGKAQNYVKAGITEKDIASFMKSETRALGLEFAWEESVCPAVFTGPATAGAHYAPTDRIVERGHILSMDFGVRFKDYVSDMQRTYYILQERETDAPQDVKHGFEVLTKAIELAKNAMKPGVQAFEIDGIAREHLVKNGYAEFPHGLGHQVGRFAHDGTALLGPKWEKYAEKPFRLLEEGMIFTIEPRLTVEGKGIVTIEEMVLVTHDGCEWLTHPQKQLLLI